MDVPKHELEGNGAEISKQHELNGDTGEYIQPNPDAGVLSSHVVKPQQRLLHDPNVTFEEYHYYALRTREEEIVIDRQDPDSGKIKVMHLLFPPKSGPGVKGQVVKAPQNLADEEKRRNSQYANLSNQAVRAHVTDEEWKDASRALRTATWAACFYLITTDILGPFGVG